LNLFKSGLQGKGRMTNDEWRRAVAAALWAALSYEYARIPRFAQRSGYRRKAAAFAQNFQ
jgi:hypothetical protein